MQLVSLSLVVAILLFGTSTLGKMLHLGCFESSAVPGGATASTSFLGPLDCLDFCVQQHPEAQQLYFALDASTCTCSTSVDVSKTSTGCINKCPPDSSGLPSNTTCGGTERVNVFEVAALPSKLKGCYRITPEELPRFTKPGLTITACEAYCSAVSKDTPYLLIYKSESICACQSVKLDVSAKVSDGACASDCRSDLVGYSCAEVHSLFSTNPLPRLDYEGCYSVATPKKGLPETHEVSDPTKQVTQCLGSCLALDTVYPTIAMSAERCRCTNFNFTALSTNCPNKCGDIDSNYECGGQAQASVTASTYRYVFRQAPPQELGRCHSLPSLSSTSQILPVSTIRLTPEYCQAMCSLARTPTRFFGIHDGQECVCFDESPVDTRECNIPCQGDSRICSGVGAVLSYPLMSKELPPYEDEQHFVGSAGFWLMLASIGLVVVISIFYTITVIRNRRNLAALASARSARRAARLRAGGEALQSLSGKSGLMLDPDDEGSLSQSLTDQACLICYNHHISTILLPCKHAVACRRCVEYFDNGRPCALCRAPVASWQPIMKPNNKDTSSSDNNGAKVNEVELSVIRVQDDSTAIEMDHSQDSGESVESDTTL